MIGGDQVRLTAVSLTTGIVLATKMLLIITGIMIRTGLDDTKEKRVLQNRYQLNLL